MEPEDPLSAKFKTLIEELMATTTLEIVKMFSKVLLETRVEISRSWREIDVLKQKLEQCEQEKAKVIFRAQMISDLKTEEHEVNVSCAGSEFDTQETNTVGSGTEGCEPKAENSSWGKRGVSLGNAETTQSSKKDASDHNIQKASASAATVENSPNHIQDIQHKQVVVNPKKVTPSKVSQVKVQQKSSDKTNKVSQCPPPSEPVSKIVANDLSANVDAATSNPEMNMKTVVENRKLIIKKSHADDIINGARALRDRQSLGTRKRCPCCTSDECLTDFLPKTSRIHQQVPSVYICRKCEMKFKTHLLFKTHKCAMPQSCSRCGQMFSTLQGLAAHSREVSPSSTAQFSCHQCTETFATQCHWNLHKSIHTNGAAAENVKDDPAATVHSQILSVPNESKAKLEVRLERISDSMLEAALLPKGASVQENSTSPASSTQTLLKVQQSLAAANAKPVPAYNDGAASTLVKTLRSSKVQKSPTSAAQTVANSLDSSPGPQLKPTVGQSNDRKVYAVMSTAPDQIQTEDNENCQESPTVHGSDVVTNKGKRSRRSDESTKGLSTPKKQKTSDCSHDAFNGVFPVEKIVRWRNNMGKREVRIKWMPCSLCGAIFQNTWEPAESFPFYLEETEKKEMQK